MLQLRKQRNQKGFTLVEIAIVLVIVGLVLFGVLRGQEMVKSAKVKKTSKQVEQLSAAVISYSDKKRGVYPGSGVPTALADLKTEGFITDDAPLDAYGGAISSAYAAATGVTFTFPNVPQTAGLIVDESFDDGNLATGNIQSAADPGLTVVVGM